MDTSRRRFMALSGAAGVGLLVPSRAWGVPGSREPAPKDPPTGAASALTGSRLLGDEPLARRAIEAAQKAGATYADARLVLWRRERIGVRDDHIRNISRSDEYGLGLRVLVDGAWGFAATNRLDTKRVDALVARAVATAKEHAPLVRQPVELEKVPVVTGEWVSPHEVDPFSVAPKEKADLMIAAAQGLLAVPGVAFASAGLNTVGEEKLFLSTEGSRTHQLYFRVLPSLTATAVDRRAGRFASRNHEIAPMLAGWEYIRDAKLKEDARVIGEQAVQKLHAAPVEPGKKKVILAPSNLWLTIHESIGHPTELDRAMGLEANYAGTSFMKPNDAGKLQIGSDIVDIIADRTQPGGLATTAWDDDGVAAQRWAMVEQGKLVGWQTTRDQAGWVPGHPGHGCSYADSYGSVTFQRMPNMSLQPGTEGYTTEDLINATDDGILISGRGSWSIDHQRYNFQFSGQFFWEIKNGRLRRPLRDVAYQANTVEFWKSCDMLGGEGTYRLGGSFSDGKGEPGQSNGVSHGCPPARFEVNVLNTGGDK